MQEKPYFCPNCRSNRVNFKVIHRRAQDVKKDAFEGNVLNMSEEQPYVDLQGDTEVQCQSCHYTAYENMFIKAAEREPRHRQEVRGRE